MLFFVILTPLRLQFSGEWMLQKRLPTLQVKQSFMNVGMISSQYNSKYFSIDFLRYRTIFNFKLIIQYGYDIIFLTTINYIAKSPNTTFLGGLFMNFRAKTVKESIVETVHIIRPSDLNDAGRLFGGVFDAMD